MPPGYDSYKVEKLVGLIKGAQKLSGTVANEQEMMDSLERRLSGLECCHLDMDPRGRMISEASCKRDSFRGCVACDLQVLKGMEDNPVIRQLQDKIEKLHYKLMEARNQNQILRKDLLVARKVLCQEVGGNSLDFPTIMKHGTDTCWKGRTEQIFVLKNKVLGLQAKIKELEDEEQKNAGGESVSSSKRSSVTEEYTKDHLMNDRKMYWRLELERRQVNQRAEKDLQVVVDECSDLRRRLDTSKARNRELIEEIKMLRVETATLMEKGRDDTGIIDALHNVESQLKDTLDDRAELRKTLEGMRIRNKRQNEDIHMLKDQVATLMDKTKDDSILIDALSNQQKQLQELVEREKMINHQCSERYKEELMQMQQNHATNTAILDQLQAALTQKEIVIQKLEEELMSDAKLLEEGLPAEEEGDAKKSPSKESKTGSVKSEMISPSGSLSGSIKSGSEENDEMSEIKLLNLECTKFKALFQSAQNESQQLTAIISTLNHRVDELTVQVVETQRLCLDKELENQELRETIHRMQSIIKGKKKRGKLWEKGEKIPTVPKRAAIDELSIRMDVLLQENNFLRAFLKSAVATKEDDFQLFRSIVDETKRMFLSSLRNIKSKISVTSSKESQKEESKEGESD